MLSAILFIFGVAVGSFFNVVIMRYDGEAFLFDGKVLGGRSHCPHCKKTLRWFELIPVVSFLLQAGRCRRCKTPISAQYPIVEIISGLIFVFVPMKTLAFYAGPGYFPLTIIWTAALEALLLASCIDIRMGIIPDELNFTVAALGLFAIIFLGGYGGPGAHSLFGPYAAPFRLEGNIWINHLFAAAAGGGFFLALVLLTPYLFKQEGMGMGDAKLAAGLGLLFGWPEIMVLGFFGFIFGAVVGVLAVALRKKTMRATIPFGPFLAAAGLVVFFFGSDIIAWYFRLAGFGG